MRIINYSRLLLFFLMSISSFSQEIDLENIGSDIKDKFKKDPFKVKGSVSGRTVSYSTNVETSRPNFTYFLNGTLNVSIYDWNIPLNFNLTNQGSKLDYELPFSFNRISIHPKYKWVQGHIGDVSMSFSSYTLNGLLFRGLGLELKPTKSPWKISVLGGRFNKAVEDDGKKQTIPSYERWGYGAKLEFTKERYSTSIIGFYAYDLKNSINQNTERSKKLSSMSNLSLSNLSKYKLLKNLELFGEISFSKVVENKDSLVNNNTFSTWYKAYNAGANLSIEKGTIGIKYERIDPNYSTLGSYYFNNDLENITLNTALSLWDSKVSVATHFGRQIDNLDNTKLKQSSRWVGSINANIKASKKLTFTTNYSNFTMFTNNRLNQFDNINNNPLSVQQPIDTIKYKQVSQNININTNYLLSNSQNLNLNYALSDVVNKENDIVKLGGISRFHNLSLNHSYTTPKSKINFSTNINYTHSKIAKETTQIIGPVMTVSKSFFDNKLQSSISGGYNVSKGKTNKSTAVNARLNLNYKPWKNHVFNFSALQLLRNSSSSKNPNLNETIINFGYRYNFGLWDKKKTKPNTAKKTQKSFSDSNSKEEINRKKNDNLKSDTLQKNTVEKSINNSSISEEKQTKKTTEIEKSISSPNKKEEKNDTIISFNNVTLEAPLENLKSKTFFTIDEGITKTINSNGNYWNFGYYYLKAPYIQSVISSALDYRSDVVNLKKIKNDNFQNCYFKRSSKLKVDFDRIVNSKQLDYINTNNISQRVERLKIGDIIEFIDSKGRKGIFLIENIKPGYTGKITISIKVQSTE